MIKTVLLLPLVLGLGACASQVGYHTGKLAAANEQLGQAVRQNIAAQTVNPQGSTAALVSDGARAALAIENYQGDNVERPSGSSTLSVQSGADAR